MGPHADLCLEFEGLTLLVQLKHLAIRLQLLLARLQLCRLLALLLSSRVSRFSFGFSRAVCMLPVPGARWRTCMRSERQKASDAMPVR